MNLNKFFSYQKELNNNILLDKKLDEYKLATRKHLALQIKLSELANETKCFVYWRENNLQISKQVILKKYIECLSDILTIGLDRNYSSLDSIVVKPNDYCLSDQFLNLFIDLNDLMISPSFDHYETLFEDFISLGISLGFSTDKMKQNFFNKNIKMIAL